LSQSLYLLLPKPAPHVLANPGHHDAYPGQLDHTHQTMHSLHDPAGHGHVSRTHAQSRAERPFQNTTDDTSTDLCPALPIDRSGRSRPCTREPTQHLCLDPLFCPDRTRPLALEQREPASQRQLELEHARPQPCARQRQTTVPGRARPRIRAPSLSPADASTETSAARRTRRHRDASTWSSTLCAVARTPSRQFSRSVPRLRNPSARGAAPDRPGCPMARP
jgi:hypothetical protein